MSLCFGIGFLLLAYWKEPEDYTLEEFTLTNIVPNSQSKRLESFGQKRTDESKSSKNITTAQSNDLKASWSETEETAFEVCFLTSVYSSSVENADHPPSVQEIRDQNPTFQFFAFTNLPDLEAPGWQIIVKNSTQYRRYITQSRWPKFMAWEHELVNKCQAVFYMDGFCSPKLKHSERYKRLARAIYESEFGLFQNKHESAIGPLDELDRIVERHKDIPKNVEASKAWLRAQPDFRANCTMYANHYIGYNPKSKQIQQASQFFWDHYSLEIDSWRDQPLWSYVLDKFNITPSRLGTFEALFREYYKLMARGSHRYDEKADNNVLQG